ncbi:hypothetical protein BY458DRAFT_555845 [Sporodiniella umbellata]|nr:hypothetical protein BY458DRAFT_555845 [Sporodiniella umbellata]
MSATINNDPFVISQDESSTISAEDTLKLLQSLNIDPSSNSELKVIYETAKNGESIDRENLMSVMGSLLADDSQHLSELVGSIGNFDIQFK